MNDEYHKIHYQLFHNQLPSGLRAELMNLLLSAIQLGGVENLVVGLWRGSAKAIVGSLDSLPPYLDISRDDVSAEILEFSPNNVLVNITTPEVRGPLEAASVVVAFNKENPFTTLRYFTLESPAEDGMPWMVGERNASGSHSNHGVIVDTSSEEFINRICSVLGWGSHKSDLSEPSATPKSSGNENKPTVNTKVVNDEYRMVQVPSTTRLGKTTVARPPYLPDLSDGLIAQSGVRGPLRFVATEHGIGVCSTSPGLRSQKYSRGVIIKIDDSSISYLATRIAPRDKVDESKPGIRFGPELPVNVVGNISGKVEITADVQTASPATRSEIDEVMITRYPVPRPRTLPQIWNYPNRMSNWLIFDTAPVFYQLSGNTSNEYSKLMPLFRRLRSRGGCYYDQQERYIFGLESTKGNAGASKLLERQTMNVGVEISKHLHLNFHVPTFKFSGGSLYFLPDEVVLISDFGDCMFVPYHGIQYQINEGTQMGVPVPDWCQPVGYTWQFMNKDGSPDRRYSNNMQIPHYRVWELDFVFDSIRIDTAFADGDLLQQLVTSIDRLGELSRNRKVRT
jgi:hypothetical protein